MTMTEEQEALFAKMTRLQRRMCTNVLGGMKQTEAYVEAGGTAKNTRSAASEILSRPHVFRYMASMEKAAADAALCTAQDIVVALMREAGVGVDEDGEPIPSPPDTCQSGRVSALKVLTNFTGGFDNNKQLVEHSGYIERSLDELYGNH